MTTQNELLTSYKMAEELVQILKAMHEAFTSWMPTMEEVISGEIILYDMMFNDDRKDEMLAYIDKLRTTLHHYGIRLDIAKSDLDVSLTLESNYYDTLQYLNEYMLQPNHHHIKISIMQGDYIRVYLNFERFLKDHRIPNEPVMNVYQRALNQINNVCKDTHILEPIEILQSLVSKECAMSLMYENEVGCYYCSYCSQVIEDETYQYCFRCGQKIQSRKNKSL